MPLPFALPLIPALKLLALGALKTIFLIVGACFFPRWTLKAIIGGASGMILPVAESMCEQGCLNPSSLSELGKQLHTIEHHEFDRPEARALLMGLVRKTVNGMIATVRAIPGNLASLWQQRSEIWSSLVAGGASLTRRIRQGSARQNTPADNNNNNDKQP